MNIAFWNLLYNHLKERHHNNQNTMQDVDYLKFLQQEQELCYQYEYLHLSDDHRKIALNWIDAIHAQNEAYTPVVFCMAMQCCFSPIFKLVDLK